MRLLKGLTEDNRRSLFFALFVIIITGLVLFQKRRENSLIENGKPSVGRVLKLKSCGKRGKCIEYEFFVNGVKVIASDRLESNWREYLKDRETISGRFYPIQYDKTNPENSVILVYERPYSLEQLLKNGKQTSGLVDKAMKVSKEYVDLRISFQYNKGDFNFRTRLHKDSLPCGNVDSCAGKRINITVNTYFPEANDLFFKSHDREHKLKDLGLK